MAFFGHSLGSLKCYTSEVVTMVLTGALTDRSESNWSQFYSQEQLRELEREGYTSINSFGESRKKVMIDQQLLYDFENINQKELLQKINCPVLIIHGNQDLEEKRLLKTSQKAIKYLSPESKIEIIDGANHRFFEPIEEVSQLSNN